MNLILVDNYNRWFEMPSKFYNVRQHFCTLEQHLRQMRYSGRNKERWSSTIHVGTISKSLYGKLYRQSKHNA